MATNKDILQRLESIENKLPNGELEEMHGMIKEIKEILLDPEDGIIVRVNKNTFWRKEIDADEFKALIRWKQTINSALYVVYTAVVGIILKLIFWTQENIVKLTKSKLKEIVREIMSEDIMDKEIKKC